MTIYLTLLVVAFRTDDDALVLFRIAAAQVFDRCYLKTESRGPISKALRFLSCFRDQVLVCIVTS